MNTKAEEKQSFPRVTIFGRTQAEVMFKTKGVVGIDCEGYETVIETPEQLNDFESFVLEEDFGKCFTRPPYEVSTEILEHIKLSNHETITANVLQVEELAVELSDDRINDPDWHRKVFESVVKLAIQDHEDVDEIRWKFREEGCSKSTVSALMNDLASQYATAASGNCIPITSRMKTEVVLGQVSFDKLCGDLDEELCGDLDEDDSQSCSGPSM